MGLPIELIYLSILPMRGGRPTDAVTAGVVGSGTAALLARHSAGADPAVACAMSVFLGLIAGELGARTHRALLRASQPFSRRSLEFPPDLDRRGLARRLSLVHLGSVAFIFVVEGLTVLILGAAAFYAGMAVTRVAEGALVRGTAYWSVLVFVIGAASIVHLFWQHRFRHWLAALRGIGGDPPVARVTRPARVGRWDLVLVFLRLLFLQGVLNRRGMQNLGLAGALGPVSAKARHSGL